MPAAKGTARKTVSLREPKQQLSIDLPEGSWPYAVLSASKSDRVYVSLWGKASVEVFSDVVVFGEKLQEVKATWPVAAHPTEMALSPDESLLYVACADANCVVVLDTATGRQTEVISTLLYPARARRLYTDEPGLCRTAKRCGWPMPTPITWP